MLTYLMFLIFTVNVTTINAVKSKIIIRTAIKSVEVRIPFIDEKAPIGARIIALADTFDALVSARAYRDSMELTKAIELISSYAGKQLDYNVVQAFLRIVDKFDFTEEEYEE